MKRTEMATIQFCSELDKVWPLNACLLALTGHVIDGFEITLGKIHASTQPS